MHTFMLSCVIVLPSVAIINASPHELDIKLAVYNCMHARSSHRLDSILVALACFDVMCRRDISSDKIGSRRRRWGHATVMPSGAVI